MKVPEGVGIKENPGKPPYERIRHHFLKCETTASWSFELPKGAKTRTGRHALGGMQHVAFAVSFYQLEAIPTRRTEYELDCDGPVEILLGLHSIYFYYPSGIRPEAGCGPAEGKGHGVVHS